MAHQLETRVLLDHAEDPALRTLEGYRRLAGGYTTQERAYRELEQDEVLKELEDSGLRGRGGAGFSMGKKASFLPRGEMAKYLCCNADESEPGTFKDRELMQRNPHQLIEGISSRPTPSTRTSPSSSSAASTSTQADILDAAVAEAYEAGYPRRRTSSTPTSASSWSYHHMARAPTSAARRRRCWTRSRASAATRASSRPSRLCRASTADRP